MNTYSNKNPARRQLYKNSMVHPHASLLFVRPVLILFLFLLMESCASAPTSMKEQEIADLKSRLGLIAITRAQYVPEVNILVPSKGPKEGAIDGAKVGALTPFRIGLEIAAQGCGSPACILLPLGGLALAPVGAAVGSIGGYITADSAKIVNEREITVTNALAKLRMQENMSDHYISRLTDLKIFPFTIIPDSGPTAKNEKPDYRQLHSRGVNSANEISVNKVKLAGWGKVKPSLYMQLEIQVRLVSTTDNSQMYCKVFTCSSQPEKFEVLAEHDAKKFQSEIEDCYTDVASWSINDIFVNDTIIGMKEYQRRQGKYLTRETTSECQ